jgi:UDP-N-acetylglucosamine 1-carboxyvinyltransferase
MRKIVIDGPTTLKGKVEIQGAKNSAMKHVVIPLISNGKYKLTNIPRISSIDNLLQIVGLQGVKYLWTEPNSLEFDSSQVTLSTQIPKELFYHTSGGAYPIPILVSRFGKCALETNPERSDYGGDQIGSRTLEMIRQTLRNLGIESKYISNILEFSLKSLDALTYKVPNGSFMASVLATFAMLFKKGKSKMVNFSRTVEFKDILDLLIIAGAKIKFDNNDLYIYGPTELKSFNYKNMPDVHDFVTFLSAALSTNSELSIENIDYSKMNLEKLDKKLREMNVKIQFNKYSTTVASQLHLIKSVEILAGQPPIFTTEWQVLLSPLLTQISGTSSVVESFYSDRMEHWLKLGKMGAKYEFFKNPKYPEVDGQPRAVKVFGPQKLHGAKVEAKDVRSGAALVIAGLIAGGKTEITGIENIERGYEDLVVRFEKLGANIKYSS